MGSMTPEEIAALASAAEGSAGFNPESIRSAVDVFADQAAAVLGALLGRKARASVSAVRPADSAAAMEGFEAESLVLRTGFEQGFHGEAGLLLRKDAAARMADGMTGGPDTGEFRSEHLDALLEWGSQVMGSVSTQLGTRYDLSLSAATPRCEDYNPSSPPFELAGGAMADVALSVDDRPLGTLRLLFAQPLVLAFADPAEHSGSVSAAPDFATVPVAGAAVDASLTMSEGAPAGVEMLLDVPLNITIELGRTRLSIRKILELGPGSIIELDRLAGEPVDLLVNDKVVARGEVVVVDEYFGIRILSLISQEERIRQLR
jgi:flagellar motor switch protein FliN/FliY